MPAFHLSIVDDDPVFSNILAMMLRQHGNEKQTFFSSAEEYLDHPIEQAEFLFLDYNMEGLHGLDALKIIKQNKPATRIVVITSSESKSIERDCLENGAELFINKNSIMAGLPASLLELLK